MVQPGYIKRFPGECAAAYSAFLGTYLYFHETAIVYCANGLNRGPMPRWTLQCENCKFVFTHSMIDDSGALNFFEPPKPEFAEGGSELECPNCGHKATYQRTELSYRGY